MKSVSFIQVRNPLITLVYQPTRHPPYAIFPPTILTCRSLHYPRPFCGTPSMPNPWAPADETSAQIFAEETWLQGALLSNIFYGIELTLFFICFKLLLSQMDRTHYKRPAILLAFISVLFVLGTLFVFSLAEFTQLAFIVDRDFPGGPAAYEKAMFWIPVDELGVVVFVMGNWLMDGLLVWRCKVIFSGMSRVSPWVIMVLPCLLWCASFTLGVLFLIRTSRSSPFDAVYISLAYFSTTLALNIVVTLLIVARLLAWRWHFSRILGADRGAHYSNIAAILVESASLYSIFSIMFLVPLALNYPLASVFLQTMGQVQTVASFLIIFRLASGMGWTEGTGAQMLTRPTIVELSSLPQFRLDPRSSIKSRESGASFVSGSV